MCLPSHSLDRRTAGARSRLRCFCCSGCQPCLLLLLLQGVAPAAILAALTPLLWLLLLSLRLLPHPLQKRSCRRPKSRVAQPPTTAPTLHLAIATAAAAAAAAAAVAAAVPSLRCQGGCRAGTQVAGPVGGLRHVWHAKAPADLHATFAAGIVAWQVWK